MRRAKIDQKRKGKERKREMRTEERCGTVMKTEKEKKGKGK